jgi:hypothetical protein
VTYSFQSSPVSPPHDALHGRVGFQRGAVDANRLAREELLGRRDLQHELKDFLEHFLRQPIAGVGQRRVIGGRFVEGKAQELPQAEAVGAAPGDASLAADSLKIADQEHAEVNAGGNRRLPALLLGGVVPSTTAFDPAVKFRLGQQRVESLIEGVPRRLRQPIGCDEQSVLPLLTPATHRHHAPSVPTEMTSRGYNTMRVKPARPG